MALYQKRTNQFKFETKHLSELLQRKPQYGANEVGVERLSNEQPRYIRITDIDEYGLLKQGMGKTANNIEPKYMLNNNELLFARSGTVGKSYIHKTEYVSYPCFYAGYMIRFVVNEEKINPDYLFIYTQLSVYKEWVNAIQRVAAQPNINAKEYQSLKIPLPPQEIQAQIVAKMDNAYADKRQKETEAQQLLDSIDNYVLGELGIELPQQPENTIENRMFIRHFSDISGGRFDPKLYDKNTNALKKAISNSSYPTLKLEEFIIQSISGDWGKDITEDSSPEYQKCLVIRATEFDNFYNLNLNNSRIKFRLIQTEKLRKIDIQTNDLLIEKSGGSPDQPVGRIAIISEELLKSHNLCYSNFIHKIRVSSLINPEYLFCFLRTIHNIKLTNSMQSQTNGIRNLIMKDYFNQKIPLPPLEKQIEIVHHIANLRNKTKELKQQAQDILEQAKLAVEQIILG